jgi:hypothetical protein
MRLDHVSYVTSHDQLADTVQRLGSRLGSAFVDGGVHPRFGTRNFTLPLQNGHYIEVVCPLDHPASDASPFGKAVSRRAAEGGGWLTWVVAVDDVASIETRLGRQAVDGHRTKPDGTEVILKHDVGSLNRIDRLTSANYSLPINQNSCKNIFITIDGKSVMLQAVSIYTKPTEWTIEEMLPIMMDVSITS